MVCLLCTLGCADFRRVVGDYLKAVSSMPGVVTNSSVGAKAAKVGFFCGFDGRAIT